MVTIFMKNPVPRALFLLFIVFSVGLACSVLRTKLAEIDDTLQEVKMMLNTLKQIGVTDPTSPEETWLKVQLDNAEQEVIAIQEGKTKIGAEILVNISKKLKTIVVNYQKGLSEIVHEDILFVSGKYDVKNITAQGRTFLNRFSQRVTTELIDNFKKTFPEDELKIFVQVIGYADSIPPSGLLQASLKSLSCLPDGDFTINKVHSKLLNKELSCRRAKSIKKYLTHNLWDNFPHNDSKLELAAIKHEGRGEQFPYVFSENNHKPYSERDERRRICKLYANVFVKYSFSDK